MPFPNFHSARVVNPDQFDNFATKEISDGINLILGIKNGKSESQAYRFNKDKFTVEQAKAWLKEHNIKVILFEKAVQAFQKNLILFTYKLQAFTQNEILELIPVDVLNKIKQKDPHPYFQLYSICHEGMSQPKLLGETSSKPIFWPRKAIQSLKSIIMKGIKLFKGHNDDNSIKGRESFGEVIHSFQQEIQGNLNHLIITYHTPEQKEEAKKFDIVSQESIWNFMESASNLIADTIEKFTGIAGGNSKIEIPAFSGAKRLGLVQAFENKSNYI
jgi:hypothetical protein